jgi:hypothetical protein
LEPKIRIQSLVAMSSNFAGEPSLPKVCLSPVMVFTWQSLLQQPSTLFDFSTTLENFCMTYASSLLVFPDGTNRISLPSSPFTPSAIASYASSQVTGRSSAFLLGLTMGWVNRFL